MDVFIGKKVESYDVKDYEKLAKIGFMNKNIDDYKNLQNRTVVDVVYRGNVIIIKFDKKMNLLIGPEYGGILTFTETEETPDYHLRLRFKDGSALTIRLTSMGGVLAVKDEDLENNYMYKRDFSDTLSPKDYEFTTENFSILMAKRNQMLKSVLVGKDAVLVGISNATYQDVIYRAGLHPKRKASSLSENEVKRLHDSILLVIEERLKLGGKKKFQDIYGNEGKYVAAMGPHMKNQNCPICGTRINSIQHGGGKVYFCPKCQL